jgi:hypothetical protein
MSQLKVSVIGTGPVGLAIASRLSEVIAILYICHMTHLKLHTRENFRAPILNSFLFHR